MALKRKRSDSEISTTSSVLSSPLSQTLMQLESLQSPPPQTPSLFSSRTRKRHRNNRPSEDAVHQHTLSLLFSAQQNSRSQSFPATAAFLSQPPIASVPASTDNSSHQSSLHSFWTIPQARQSLPSSISTSSPPISLTASPYLNSTNCEDCDVPLNPNEEDGDAMDVDMYGGSETNHACLSCGKQVCHSCAVSNLGADRKCLMCAGKGGKIWVGGVGWMDQD